MRRSALLMMLALFVTPVAASEFRLREAPLLSERVAKGQLPPLTERLPETMLIVEPNNGRTLGLYGGEIRTLAVRARDLRYMAANGYTRLVGYNEELECQFSQCRIHDKLIEAHASATCSEDL